MCDKAVDICPFVFDPIPDPYKTQKIYDKVVSKEPFMLRYCLDKYKTQEMCDKVINSMYIGKLYLRHNLGYRKHKLLDVIKFVLVLPTFRLIQQSLSRNRC